MASITLPFDRPLSHPPENDDDGKSSGVALVKHLDEVGTRARTLAERGGADRIVDVTQTAGQLHDFGKVTPYFQFHIAGNTPTPSYLKNHSPLGALAAYHVLDARGFDQRLALVALVAIARHHGTLPDVIEYVSDTALGEQRARTLATQLEGINRTTADTVNQILERESNGTTKWETFREAVLSGDLKTTIEDWITRRGGQLDPAACSPQFYDWIIQVWGALVIADKTSAAGIDTDAFDASYGDPRAVRGHVRTLQLEPERDAAERGEELSPELRELNRYRDQARESIVENACAITQAHGNAGWVGKLTLPTGLGKTLTALETGQVISAEQPTPGRIIYALPYTSIVDQTATVIEKVFEADKTTNELTIHHHLEEVVTQLEAHIERRKRKQLDPDQYADDEYLTAKGWNSGMVLTTFVQLFESLVRPTNQQVMKLPALYNSVIILDEPQALPLDWWRLIRRLIETLVEEYNATVISMTATQPKIITEEALSTDVHKLVDDPDQYFELVERVEYQYDRSLEEYFDDPEEATERTHTEAAATIVDNLSDEEPTGLAICNTVASATNLTDEIDGAASAAGYERLSLSEVYDPLAKRDDETFDLEADETVTECRAQALIDALETRLETATSPLVTLHLTTRHRPTDRKVLLEAASALSEARTVPFVFVSTQLIEAGVDISFTRVYRDFAPVSSIVQAAGRCNRSAERDRGIVTVWRLEPTASDKLPPSEYPYGIGEYDKLGPTARALQAVAPARSESGGPRTVREMAVAQDGVETYYEILDCERDVGKQEYVDWLETAQFGKMRALSLIDERDQFDVLVCRSEKEYDRAEVLLEAAANGETEDAYEQLSALEETQVSLPTSAVRGETPRDSAMAVLGTRVVFVVDDFAGEGAYSPRTGLRE